MPSINVSEETEKLIAELEKIAIGKPTKKSVVEEAVREYAEKRGVTLKEETVVEQ